MTLPASQGRVCLPQASTRPSPWMGSPQPLGPLLTPLTPPGRVLSILIATGMLLIALADVVLQITHAACSSAYQPDLILLIFTSLGNHGIGHLFMCQANIGCFHTRNPCCAVVGNSLQMNFRWAASCRACTNKAQIVLSLCPDVGIQTITTIMTGHTAVLL